jgi:hypothetical protein
MHSADIFVVLSAHFAVIDAFERYDKHNR